MKRAISGNVICMQITADIFEAYLNCPTKCYLRAHNEAGIGNAYADWVQTETEAYRSAAIKRLKDGASPDEHVTGVACTKDLKAAKWRLAFDVVAQSPSLESKVHAIERIPPEGRGRAAQLIPVRFVSRNKLTKNDRLLSAFDAFVLSEMLGRPFSIGKIIHGDDPSTLKMKTPLLRNRVGRVTEKIGALLSTDAAPDLLLNRHCGECEFQSRCRQKAVERDDLSLLSGISEKERKKQNSKGIFTVTQLSYTFRPRRRPKRLRNKREKYHHALKALAIRERKIHIVGTPELRIEGTPIYLDVEGLPDRDFYYLIGVRIGTGESAVQHSLWADNLEDEKRIWRDFLAVLDGIESPVLIHYGSYETIFLKRMCDRYGEPPKDSGTAKSIHSPMNILSTIFAQIYVPTYSNSLKSVASWLGFSWSEVMPSGLNSIVYRSGWESTRNPSAKQQLLMYNADDCKALELVTRRLGALCGPPLSDEPSIMGEVIHTARMKREHPYGFKRNVFCLEELDAINKAAYWDYQRERIYMRADPRRRRALRQRRRVIQIPPIKKTLVWTATQCCPKCGSTKVYRHQKLTRIVYDLRFTVGGVRRWITRFHFHRYKCKSCRLTFNPPNKISTRSKYGSGLLAYAVYQNIALRLPQESVDFSLNRLFGLNVPLGVTHRLKTMAASAYDETYGQLIRRIVGGRLIHADETKVSVKGDDAFV